MNKEINALSPRALTPTIDMAHIKNCMNTPYPESLSFIGQNRAQAAIDFALGMEMPGYNLYVMGEAALGRFSMVENKLMTHSKTRKTPLEWLYLNNYDDHREPIAICLQPGESKVFCDDMDSLIDEIMDTFPAAFDNPGFQRKKKAIDRAFNTKYDSAIDKVEVVAAEHSIALFEENDVLSFAPVVDGKQLDDAEFSVLSDEQKQYFYDVISKLEDALIDALIELPRWKRESSEKLRELKKSTAEQAIKPLLKELEFKYDTQIGILKYLKEIKSELIDTVLEWLDVEADDNKDDLDKRGMLTDYFAPNLLVSYKENDAAPVIYEPNPTFSNVFGKVEYGAHQGSLITSYRAIQSGALHKANGGYLMMDADKVMASPQLWDALKLSLKTHQIKNDLLAQDSALGGNYTLRPQLIPLDVKIVLLGSRDLYYLMQEYDEEFNEQFRVLADFEFFIPGSDKFQYQFISKVQEHALDVLKLELTKEGIAELLNFSYRQAEHQTKLSARFADILELLNESSYYAKQDLSKTIEAHHISEALAGKQYRTGQMSESMLSDIKEGHTLIDTQGEAIGKVNGLTVLHVGDTSFGSPARITATVYAGSEGVLDIEREAELGKAIHSKGVMLLTGYLGNKYAQDFALTLSSSIAIEQSYGYIDGDSASLAELCALISAITRLPIDQSIALTGSINQHGEVQAIGGVNEKIEGFFKLCKMRGLTGKQGVMVPHSNSVNLVLNQEVQDAVSKGYFQIYTVKTVDQALEILLDKPAGTLSGKGTYAKGTINYIALQRLSAIAEVVNGSDSE
ncbi:Lon protease family protein [Pseudoalteromonas denitrificans]|uniref:endopeptidase La n=1 Tax=Pseudoalteromonas denitrificans DSM 6059 TaxID=1123010 RepID=A0A1I1HZE9_9GAMM|nr:ATP-binding protein [Pseudoalteromonas denitrificans]SFC28952.1 lon-related putative ATP-dependent protease [Pseudoalteromonas denitrificans DSM 6059]